MSLKGTLEYAKLSISGFGAEVLLNEGLINAIITELDKVEEMQKALEFYGNKDNWELPSFGRGHSPVIADRGERARQALKGDTQ